MADGYLQRWEDVPRELVPPSGIAGYRVTVNMNSDSDPCSGADDSRACGGPITEIGQDNLSRTLRNGDLLEGANHVHVVPISGAGMRATEVKHTQLKVDLADPSVDLQGDGNGEWINHVASLRAVATDSLSGMANTGEFPGDEAPAVLIEYAGGTDEARNTDTNAYEIGDEGTHQVRYWARDLAGNTNQPETRTVRIDKTDPSVAFTNAQYPADPDKLVAPVSDALSGVVEGRISYRQVGGSGWKASTRR